MAENSRMLLCPYCGHLQAGGERCEQCHGLFEALSQQATQIAMGPWFIRDTRNPFRPGCSYEVILRQIQGGKIAKTTIIRGPTTHQFWVLARHAPGIAHLLGVCHRCGADVDPTARACPECNETFSTPLYRNELGLMYPSVRAAAQAQRMLARKLAAFNRENAADASPDDIPTPPQFEGRSAGHAAHGEEQRSTPVDRADDPLQLLADAVSIEPLDFADERMARRPIRWLPRWLAPQSSDPLTLLLFIVAGLAIALVAALLFLAAR